MGVKARKAIAILSVAVMMLSNLSYSFANSLDVLTSKNAHTFTLKEAELEEALKKASDNSETETYEFLQKEPIKTVVINGETQSVTQPKETKEEYKLTKELKEVIEKIHLPHESNLVKQQLLTYLQNKTFVRFYDIGEKEGENETCQVLLVADNKTKELSAITINTAEEEQKLSFQVERNDKKIVNAQGERSQKKAVTQRENVKEDELETLKNKENTETEVIDITEHHEEKESEEQKEIDALTSENKEGSEQEENNQPEKEITTTYKVNILEETTSDKKEKTLKVGGNTIAFLEGLSYEKASENKEEAKEEINSNKANGEISLFGTAVPGKLSGYKTATQVEGTSDLNKINLEMTGKDGTVPVEGTGADVVVVVDLSKSMNNASGDGLTRWQQTKKALDSISDELLTNNANGKVQLTLAGFAGHNWRRENDTNRNGKYHQIYQEFTPDSATFKNAYSKYNNVESMRVSKGNMTVNDENTNAQAGFVAAAEALKGRENNGRSKYVIFLSDGIPVGFYYNQNPFQEHIYVGYANSEQQQRYANAVTLGVDGAIGQAKYLKDQGVTVVSVGMDMSQVTFPQERDRFLKGVASKPEYSVMVNSTELNDTVKSIATQIKDANVPVPHGTVKLTDNISEYVKYVDTGGGVHDVKAEFSTDNGKTWKTYTGAQVQKTTNPQGEVTKLSLDIPNFNSAYKYRIVYFVRVRQAYYGQKLHADQTDGFNPQPGSNPKGVVANGETYLTSDQLTQKQHIKVPAVYASSVAPTLEGDKRANKVEDTHDVFQVNLDILGKDGMETIKQQGADIVAVVDLSSSMDNASGSSTRWKHTQKALDAVSAELLENNPSGNVEIALVGFAGHQWKSENDNTSDKKYHEIYQDFTDDPNLFKNAYTSYDSVKTMRASKNSMTVNDDNTNAMAGFVAAKEAFASQENNGRNKYVIFLSDGVPTGYYTKMNPFQEYVYVGWGDDTKKGLYEACMREGIKGAISQANLLKDDDVTIISVGMDMTGLDYIAERESFFKGISSSDDMNLMVNSGQLETTVKTIAEQIRDYEKTIAHEEVTVVDNISEFVDYIDTGAPGVEDAQLLFTLDDGQNWYVDSAAIIDKEYNPQGGVAKLTLKIPDFNSSYKYRLQYYVKVKEEYYGEKIHKDQTDGVNPESGTDGVIANRETYMKSKVVDRKDIDVPTVYADPLGTPFEFKKIKGHTESEGLEGAAFMLYECDKNHTHEPAVTQEVADNGNCWKPMFPDPIVSGSDGKVDFGFLPDGEYILVETETPMGYQRPVGQWRIKAKHKNPNGPDIEITEVTALPKPPAFKVDPVTKGLFLPNLLNMVLPESGLNGIFSYLLAGVLIMGMSLVVYWYSKRKRQLKE